MEGYKRIVVEVPVEVKKHLDELAEYDNRSIKDWLIESIQLSWMAMMKVRITNEPSSRSDA